MINCVKEAEALVDEMMPVVPGVQFVDPIDRKNNSPITLTPSAATIVLFLSRLRQQKTTQSAGSQSKKEKTCAPDPFIHCK